MRFDFRNFCAALLLCLLTGVATRSVAQVSPTITAGGPTSFCSNDSVLLTVSPQNASYTYQWLRGTGIIPGATSASYWVKLNGTYKVIIISPSGRRDTSAGGIVVTTTPINATVTPPAPTNLCNGVTSLTLYGFVSNTYNYQWLQGNIPIAGATTNNYTVTAPGVYRLLVTNRANNCTDTSAPRNIQAVSNPVATISPAGNATRCATDSLVLQAATPNASQWQWFYGNTPISGATAARYVARTYGGDYRVQVRDSNGCQSDTSAPVSLTINPTPTANIAFSGAVSFCEGSSITLNTQTEPGNLIQWIIDGVLRPQDNASFKTVATSGTYRIQTSNAYGCTAVSPLVPVTVYATPQPIVTRNGLTLRVANSQAFVYQWYRNTVALPGEVYRSYTATAIGSYTVKVTDGHGCEGTSTPEFISSMAVENLSPDDLRLYPNPTADVLHINAPVAVAATLQDITGRQLFAGKNVREIDFSGLAQGVYVLRLSDAEGRVIKTEKIFRK